MRLIDKLVSIDILPQFLNGMLMFLVLLFAATYLFPATDLIVKGLPIILVLKFVLYSLPSLVTQTFPMAMLLASLLSLGRISADSEMVAILAAGISFGRAIRAIMVLGAVVSVVAFLWNDYVVPPCSAIALQIRRDAEKHLTNTNKELHYTVEDANGLEEDVDIRGGFDAKTQTLRNVTIVKHSSDPKWNGQPEVVLYCMRAKANDQKGLNWTYYDGYLTVYSPTPDGHSLDNVLINNFHELASLPKGTSMGKRWDDILSSNRDDPNSKSFATLYREIKADQRKGMETGGLEVDLYGKLALPIASLIFGVVGAALGKNTQRGGGKTVGFGMAIFIVFLYWIFYHSMYVVGKGGGMSPLFASFLPDIVGAMVGIALTVRASR